MTRVLRVTDDPLHASLIRFSGIVLATISRLRLARNHPSREMGNAVLLRNLKSWRVVLLMYIDIKGLS